MFLKFFSHIVLVSAALTFSFSAQAEFVAPVDSTDDYRHFLAKIPAPRGLIVDRNGKTLAVSKTGKRIAVRLLKLQSDDPEADLPDLVTDMARSLSVMFPSVEVPELTLVEKHFTYRPYIPFPISGLLTDAELEALAELGGEAVPALEIQSVITREYPAGKSTPHFIGFVGQSMPDQHGPYGKEEYLWPTMEGRKGLEESMDATLRGREGLVSLLFDREGNEVNREILEPPVPGWTVVTTVDLNMQELALRELEKSKHNGAFVAVDSENGDILALASYPGFDPNEFVPSITAERFRELSQADGSPFFDRAVSGSYPPGSTFKPIVALACLASGKVSRDTKYSGPPSYYVGDHEFKNWNDNHEGSLDVRYAILRSCNTWFYQAAIDTRSQPIIEAAHRFRIGMAPEISLNGVSGGHMPSVIPSDGRIANVSIGQGQVLVSPLQIATAMTGFANRDNVVKPRLILQTQHPLSGDLDQTFPADSTPLRYPESAVNTVREGMWGVVNYGRGTGRSAALSKPHVFGKTGTAQWFHEGEERRLGWFTGFADAENPKIAFAMVAEGAVGETMSGGRNAAPYCGNFLREIYTEPDTYLVSIPEKILTPEPRLTPATHTYATRSHDSRSSDGRNFDPRVISAQAVVARPAPRPRQKKRGLFSRLFGRN